MVCLDGGTARSEASITVKRQAQRTACLLITRYGPLAR
jgi:hypothetical protein